ncbi:MAG: 2-oxoglutarate dehydrogenase, E2 component, dihydrolipoamide succinyltransferase [Nostocoides sp.]
MSERVTMPALGESVTEGTVTRWLKSVGDTIAVDEPLLEVSTDKVDTEIPSPVAGVLEQVLVEEDETVPVGADLAVIGDGSGSSGESEQTDTATQPAQVEAAPPAPVEATPPAPDESAPSVSADAAPDGQRVVMPALGESVTEGTVTRWLKSEGDQVAVDEPLLEVSTDKVDTEIPSPVAGTLTKVLVAEDETVPVGAELAIVGGSTDDSASAPTTAFAPEPPAPAPAPPAPAAAPPAQPAPPAPVAAAPAAPAPPTPVTAPPAPAPVAAATATSPATDESADASTYVTPLVRKLAADNDIDLTTLTGSGIGGRIRKQDVLDAVAARQAPAATEAETPASPSASTIPAPTPTVDSRRGTTEKMSRLRQTIAKRMVESLQVSAQLTTVVEVDVTKIARLRERGKAEFERREGTKLSFLPFFALAACEALKAFPTLNASIDGDQVTYHGVENLGMAVDTDKGLLVPVIANAGDLNIAGLARAIADLADRTRSNRITPDELGGGTFTLTNTGSRGALFDTPIINQPQVAILGTGAVVKRPVVVTDADGGETIAVRSMVYLALSYDHRLVDGADAARFLTAVKSRLEDGQFEV